MCDGDSANAVQNNFSSKIVLQNPPQQEWSCATLSNILQYNKLRRCLSITVCALAFYYIAYHS